MHINLVHVQPRAQHLTRYRLAEKHKVSLTFRESYVTDKESQNPSQEVSQACPSGAITRLNTAQQKVCCRFGSRPIGRARNECLYKAPLRKFSRRPSCGPIQVDYNGYSVKRKTFQWGQR